MSDYSSVITGHDNKQGTIAGGKFTPIAFRQRMRLAWRMLRRGI